MADEDTRTTKARPPFMTPTPESASPETPRAKLESADAAAIMAKLEEMEEHHRGDMVGVRQMITDTASRDAAAHIHARKHMRRMWEMTFQMWRQVYGSKPPPPPTPGSGEHLAFTFSEDGHKATNEMFEKWDKEILGRTPENGVPIAEASIVKKLARASETDLEVEGVKGQILAISSKVNDLTKVTDTLLSLQKEQMGKKPEGPDDRGFFSKIGDAILYAVREREGQRHALAILTAIGVIITSAATIATIVSGRGAPPSMTAPHSEPHEPPQNVPAVRP